MIVKKELDLNNPEPLSSKDIQLLKAAQSKPIVFDSDCPETSDAELQKMHRTNKKYS